MYTELRVPSEGRISRATFNTIIRPCTSAVDGLILLRQALREGYVCHPVRTYVHAGHSRGIYILMRMLIAWTTARRNSWRSVSAWWRKLLSIKVSAYVLLSEVSLTGSILRSLLRVWRVRKVHVEG